VRKFTNAVMLGVV